VRYLLYEKNNELQLADKKVIYTERGETKEKYIGLEGEKWWNDIANKHEHINIVEITEVTYTNEQLARYEEVKTLKGNLESLREYILNGEVIDVKNNEIKTIMELKLKNENKELEGVISDLTQLLIGKGVIY
jgi:hypothetical protein